MKAPEKIWIDLATDLPKLSGHIDKDSVEYIRKDALKVKEVDLEKETIHYLLYEHRSPLNEIMHKADLKSEMQYHKDIENAYKAGFELGLKAQKGKKV